MNWKSKPGSHIVFLGRWFVFFIVGIGGVMMSVAGCTDTTVAGKKASEIFEDEKVVMLANAATRGDAETINKLVQQGADINFVGKDGLTPLLWTLFSLNKEGMKALLKYGADPNHKMTGGYTATGYAAQTEDSEYLKILLANGADPDLLSRTNPPMTLAMMANRLDNIDILLSHGANINVVDSTGSTVAMSAEGQNKYDYVIYLLERGADHAIVDNTGWTLAHDVQSKDPSMLIERVRLDRESVIDMLEAKGVKFPLVYPKNKYKKFSWEKNIKEKELPVYYK